jgi:hypothetical protein
MMKKICSSLGAILLSLIFFSSTAFAWGSATHAYIDDQLMKRKGLKNLNEIYGGMAPDIFNYLFEVPFQKDLYMQTHYQFLKVWDQAKTGTAKALAYGFVSHNDLWGADSTAHHAGRTFGLTEGYVIAKAKELSTLAPLPSELGIPSDAALELYHNFVESGVDLLVKRLDPAIGDKMISSALRRSREFPYLLVRAYGADLAPYFGSSGEAAKAITSAEMEFRKTTILYGQALMQDEGLALNLVSEQMAGLAEKFLGAYGIPAPPKEQAIQLIAFYITVAMTLCEQDFAQEIAETQSHVSQQMSFSGISY